MTDLYDDAMVEAAADYSIAMRGLDPKYASRATKEVHADMMRRALDAVAPLIAAKALRDGQAAFERAADMAENQTGRALNLVVAEAFGKRAHKIERGE